MSLPSISTYLSGGDHHRKASLEPFRSVDSDQCGSPYTSRTPISLVN
jgi:hypothetical protein